MPAEAIEVCVYKSEKRSETYVYIPVGAEFDDLPEAFRDHFGAATAFLNFWLDEEKILAQADARHVLAAIADQGFYVQLPPPPPSQSVSADG